MSAPDFWPIQIGYGAQLRARLVELFPDTYLELTVPHLAASPDVLQHTEDLLGMPLDAQHREFLTYADGWPDFFMDGDLLSSAELLESPPLARARNTLDRLYGNGVPDLPERTAVTVIAASIHCDDLFAIDRAGPETDGGHPVYWLAHEVVDRFDNFIEYFQSANAYLRRDIDKAGGLPPGYRPTIQR